MAELRSVAELLDSVDGRRFLEEHEIFSDRQSFCEALRPPADRRLTDLLGLGPESHVVCFGHQISVDYKASVACKFLVARELADAPPLVPVFVPVDTDRCGGTTTTTTVAWGEGPTRFSLRLVSNKFREMETRFVPSELVRRQELVDRLSDWLSRAASAPPPETWRPRLDALAAAVLDDRVESLAQVNQAVTSHLLQRHIGYDPPRAFVSELGACGLMTTALTEALQAIDDFVSTYNGAIEALVATGIDPQVRPLSSEYLPLHYACPKDGRRERLKHVRQNGDHFAVASCYCGAEYRFHLGRGSLSVDEVVATDRWSTDVSFLVYLNDLLSGIIAGRSSALYGLVLKQVCEQVLSRRPVPVLVPDDLARDRGPADADSLLHEYLTAP